MPLKFLKETLVGGVNGIIFALLMGDLLGYGLGILAWGVIAIAMSINLLVAGIAGIPVPLTIHIERRSCSFLQALC